MGATKDIVPITLRFPSEELHGDVIELAKQNNRSLNSEIIHRLKVATQEQNSDSPIEAFCNLSKKQQSALIEMFNVLQSKGMV